MVLVTGATGFLGGELVQQLVARGEQVRIIKRKTSSLSHLDTILSKVDVVEADILDIPSLETAFEGVEKIYHSAAVVGYDASFYNDMYKSNIEGTANVVNIALVKGVKKLLHVSSIAAIGGKPNECITEETKWEKNEWTTHYGITKMLAEREVWRGVQEGLDAVIVNPGIIIGYSRNENKATMRLFNRIAQKKMPFYSDGTNGFVDVKDVAAICTQLMNNDIHAERFILVNENISFKDYFERIAKQLNAPPPKMKLYKTNGYLAVVVDWFISKLANRKRNITKENLKISLDKFEYSNEKIRHTLNYNFIPLDETIEQIAMQIN